MKNHASLAHLISSNDIPNAVESEIIRLGIAGLKSKISHLRLQLQELEGELHQQKGLLSPVRRLPLEVIGEIFKLIIPRECLSWRSREELLHLCLVCKNWRDAAHLTRQFWSELSVFDYYIPYEGLMHWLGRSGNLPKAIEIVGSCSRIRFGEQAPCYLDNHDVARFLACGPSFDHVSVHCESPLCFQNMVDGLDALSPNTRPRPWDSIRSLTLTFDGKWEDSSDSTQSPFCRISPTVTSLQLHLPDYNYTDDTRNIPLHLPHFTLERLTSFSITCDWEGIQLPMVLQHCVNVEDLTINFNNDRHCMWFDPSNATIQGFIETGLVLPKLRTLCLQEARPRALEILRLLKTPVLVSLALEFSQIMEDVYDQSFAKRLRKFVTEQSGCGGTFRRLLLNSFEFQEGVLRFTMRSLPSITHLTLNYPKVHPSPGSWNPSILSEFYGLKSHADTKLLPNLESLQLLNLDPGYLITPSTYDISFFLSSRRRFDEMKIRDDEGFFIGPPDSLKELVITFQRAVRLREHGLEDFPPLQMFRKHCGVSFTIGPRLYY